MIKDFAQLSEDKKKLLYRFLIYSPIIFIVIKSIFLQAYVYNDNPYGISLIPAITNTLKYTFIYLAFPLLFYSASFLLKGKSKLIYIVILNIFCSALMLLDVTYYRGFYTFPSIMLIEQTANLNNMGGTILSMFSIYDIFFVLDIIIWIILYIKSKSFVIKFSLPNKRLFTYSFVFSLFVTLITPFNYYILGNKDIVNADVLEINDATENVQVWGPIGYHIQDLIVVNKDSKPYFLSKEDKDKIQKYYNVKKEHLPNNEYFGAFKNHNLLVIQVESLESFVLKKEINGQKITPVLDNLIDSGLYFPNIYEQVNEGTSSDSDLMVNTSMFPLRRGATFFRKPDAKYNSLPEILEGYNYETYAIHPDKGEFWNYRKGHGGIGFDTFWDESTFNYDEELILGLSDESFFKQIAPRIEKMKEPFYTFAVTLTNHCPFNLPMDKRDLILDPELDENKMGGYLQCVNYTDTQIGKFLNELDKSGVLENTLVAIVGDHTGIHKYYNQDINKLSNPEDWFLYDGTPRIPFILWSKNSNLSKTFNTIGGQIDIMPTLLYALGVDASEYENTALGRNLLNTKKSFAISADNEFFGEDNLSQEEKELQLEILELSDKMIRANYFNN